MYRVLTQLTQGYRDGSLVRAELNHQWLQHALSFFDIHIYLVYKIDYSLLVSQPNKNSTFSIL